MGRGKALIVLWDPSGEVSPLLDSAGFEPVCLGPSRTQEADPRWWSERVEELLERGEPGVLICTLPGSAGSSVHEVEPAEVARFFDAFKGVLFLLRAILPLMMALSGGSVYLVPPEEGILSRPASSFLSSLAGVLEPELAGEVKLRVTSRDELVRELASLVQ